MKKTVSIIIVHWNTPKSLKSQLKILSQSKNFQIIVIDNASKESIGWVKKDFPSVELIVNKLNRGYAFACNQGVIKSEGRLLLFFNPDVEIEPDQLNEMIEYAEENHLDACSVKTTNSYQKPLPSWLSLLIEFTPMNRFIGANIFSIKTLFGGCLLIKSEVLKSIGGWDERFFLWFEDSDLTLRLLKNNYKIGWINLAIKHSGGESFKKLDQQFKRDVFFHSMDVYAKKHFSFFGNIIVSLIKRKYTQRKLLPSLFDGISITVPNTKVELLSNFFENNKQVVSKSPYTSGVQWVVVTSSIVNSDIWDWRSRYPEVSFIPIEKNNGFASTVNIGFRVSTGKWVGTVNDDIILSRNSLNDILICTNQSVGSINPIILNREGSVESIGVKVLSKGKAEPIKVVKTEDDRILVNQPNRCLIVDATNAAAVVYFKEALNKIGLFDEKFGSYLEDIDLSIRLKRGGYKNVVSLKSKVIHIGQSSSKDLGIKKQFYDFRNWIYVIFKNWSLADIVFNFPSIFIERLRNISGLIKKCISL